MFSIKPQIPRRDSETLDFPLGHGYNRYMSQYPYGIENFPQLPEKLRTQIMKEWNRSQIGTKSVGRPSKYPWDKWMDGRHHTALAGRDFHQSVLKFRDMLRSKGYHSGYSVETDTYTVDERGPTGPVQYWVRFRFFPKEVGIDITEIDDRSWISDEAIAALTEDVSGNNSRPVED